jgi:hypothetical protein
VAGATRRDLRSVLDPSSASISNKLGPSSSITANRFPASGVSPSWPTSRSAAWKLGRDRAGGGIARAAPLAHHDIALAAQRLGRVAPSGQRLGQHRKRLTILGLHRAGAGQPWGVHPPVAQGVLDRSSGRLRAGLVDLV